VWKGLVVSAGRNAESSKDLIKLLMEIEVVGIGKKVMEAGVEQAGIKIGQQLPGHTVEYSVAVR
jgi:hypothetical protein